MFTRRYVVFDCAKASGYSVAVGSAWLARLIAHYLSWRTGRFHDFDSYGQYIGLASSEGL